jgi:peroxiredoxin Q/BCP
MHKQNKLNSKKKIRFPFPLLADEDKSVIEAFCLGPKKVYGKRIRWNSQNDFVIDENGIIDEVIEKLKLKPMLSRF